MLIVGSYTDNVTKGGCQLCPSYNSHTYSCGRNNTVDYRSFIRYECDKAVKDKLQIVDLYNSAEVNRKLCPEVVRSVGTHCQMWYRGTDGKNHWDINRIIQAIG